MARELRLEFPGTYYHVINRANYRRHIFGTAGTQLAFKSCLFEACAKSGLILHAFVNMGTHDHVAVETRTTDPPIPRAIFDPKPANPAAWPATPTNGFPPDSPKPVLRTAV